MERLRKIRRSALFVDVLLLIAAVLSIIGLSLFVRFHGTPKPAVADTPIEKISEATPSYGVLDASIDKPSDTPSGSSPTSSSQADQTVISPGEAETKSALGIPIPPVVSQAPQKAVCDETKKVSLKTAYNKDVTKENERYEQAVSARYSLIGGLLMTLDMVRQQLLPEHQKNLATLRSTLQSQLTSVHC